ncbi:MULTISPECIES: SDR family NAD(P)-dependent oxidoreductase [unclassified Rhizobium]|uniref:SDR family NAD(P)-dependent oxidoreductase n=1 Tax=unclassified Rhizobium TaxID=2613769 RepID=UPI00382BB358
MHSRFGTSASRQAKGWSDTVPRRPKSAWVSERSSPLFETNTFGVIAVCRAIIPHMRAQGAGVIVNVTSSTTIAPMPLVAIYTASKCAVAGFTQTLCYELELLGMRARIVEPGLAPTTNFWTYSTGRVEGLTPAPYDAFASSYFVKLKNYPTAFTDEREVAEAVFSAATPGRMLVYWRNFGGRPPKTITWLRCGRCSGLINPRSCGQDFSERSPGVSAELGSLRWVVVAAQHRSLKQAP